MKVTIYTLIDPRTCKVRYIGRTKNTLEQRLLQHVAKAITAIDPANKNNKNHNYRWLRQLLSENLIPVIKKITEVEGWKESHLLEQKLIEKHKHRNLTNGRDYGVGNSLTPAVIENISKSLKKHYETKLNSKAKPIEVYDLKGNFIKICESATTFANEIGVKPRLVTRVAAQEKGRKSVKGFQVKYQNDTKVVINEVTYEPSVKKGRVFENKRKDYTIQCKDTKETYSFKGVLEVCDFLKCSRSHFNVCKRENRLLLGIYQILPGSV